MSRKALGMHNILNLQVEGLQQLKTMMGSTPVNQQQKYEAAVFTVHKETGLRKHHPFFNYWVCGESCTGVPIKVTSEHTQTIE